MSDIDEAEPYPTYDHSSDPDFGADVEDEFQLPPRHNLRTRRTVYYGPPPVQRSDSDSDSDAYRRSRSSRRLSRKRKSSPKPQTPKRKRRPTPRPHLYPEDVPWKPASEANPLAADAEVTKITESPSVAFLVIFIQTFASLFSDFPSIVGPKEIEWGLTLPKPSDLMERLFVRLLGLVLNRKKDIEIGRYGSALSELHSQLAFLGTGDEFPPLNWKSKDAFAELEKWEDRLELLHVLVHWSLTNSERVRELLSDLDEEYVRPWLGVGYGNSRYYLVEGANEMRIYKESSTLLSIVAWKEVATTSTEVKALIKELSPGLLPPEPVPEVAVADAANASLTEAADPPPENGEKSEQDNEDNNLETIEEEEKEAVQETPERKSAHALAQALFELLPEFEAQEAIKLREAKRLKRRDELARHAEFLRQGGGRTRTRRVEIDFAAMFAEPESDSDDNKSRFRGKRQNLRPRDNTWEPKAPAPEVETETRQQRYARLAEARVRALETQEEQSSEENDNIASEEHEAASTPSGLEQNDEPQSIDAPAVDPVPAPDRMLVDKQDAIAPPPQVTTQPALSLQKISSPEVVAKQEKPVVTFDVASSLQQPQPQPQQQVAHGNGQHPVQPAPVQASTLPSQTYAPVSAPSSNLQGGQPPILQSGQIPPMSPVSHLQQLPHMQQPKHVPYYNGLQPQLPVHQSPPIQQQQYAQAPQRQQWYQPHPGLYQIPQQQVIGQAGLPQNLQASHPQPVPQVSRLPQAQLSDSTPHIQQAMQGRSMPLSQHGQHAQHAQHEQIPPLIQGLQGTTGQVQPQEQVNSQANAQAPYQYYQYQSK